MHSNTNSADVRCQSQSVEQGPTDRAETPIETSRHLGRSGSDCNWPSVPDLARFNLSIDSKLRGCDLVKLQVGDVVHSGRVIPRATVMQQKTGQPVEFELDQTREAVRGLDRYFLTGAAAAGESVKSCP